MRRIFAILAAALLFVGCAKSPEDAFIGAWADPDEGLTVQFFEDGTLVLEEGRNRASGNFQILGEDQLSLELAEPGGRTETIVATYRFEGENLVLIAPDGDTVTMTRVDDGTSQSAGSGGSSSSAASIRAQVNEGLNLSAGAKAAVSEFYMDQGRWPATNVGAGLADAHEIYGRYVESVAVENGVITITYGKDAHDAIQGKTMLLKPTATDGSISWACSSLSIAPEYLPAACRGN